MILLTFALSFPEPGVEFVDFGGKAVAEVMVAKVVTDPDGLKLDMSNSDESDGDTKEKMVCTEESGLRYNWLEGFSRPTFNVATSAEGTHTRATVLK